MALFAELLQEMLQQRFGRAILRALEAIDAAKANRSASRRDGKDDGKEDSKAPGSASKKRERSAEPADGDVEMADAERRPAADAGDSAAAAKRQKTEAATGEHVQAELVFCSSSSACIIHPCILTCTVPAYVEALPRVSACRRRSSCVGSSWLERELAHSLPILRPRVCGLLGG